jgi:hypothetical protein
LNKNPTLQQADTLKYFATPTPLLSTGGSDKSGIFFFFLLNGTAQLKIIRFY